MRAVGGLYATMDALGLKILAGIARYLGLGRDAFAPTVRDGDSVLRLLHYPPVAGAGPAVRAGAHEDINAITLLLGAEEAGLELLDRDGAWLALDPPPGSLVVNIGDMLQRLTNHRLPSTTHRVVNPTGARRGFSRYSMPFFLHFAPDYRIETLPACVGRPAQPLPRTDHRPRLPSPAPGGDPADRLIRVLARDSRRRLIHSAGSAVGSAAMAEHEGTKAKPVGR